MQNWFFLEDPRNAIIRKTAGEAKVENEVFREENNVLPKTKQWLFKVRVKNLRADEVACVTGNVPELGCWNPEKCFPLKKIDEDLWSGSRQIPGRQKVLYRYCVCSIVAHTKDVLVRSWETNADARFIKPRWTCSTQDESPEIYGTYGGATNIDRGWLTKGAVIKLKLYKKPFTLWKSCYKNRSIFVKVSLVNVSTQVISLTRLSDESINSREDDNLPKYSYVNVARLSADNPEYSPQGPYGEKVLDNDMLMFEGCVLDPEDTAFLIDLYIYSSKAVGNEPPYLCGFAYLLPYALAGSGGSVVLPITSSIKQKPLGEMKLEYLVMHPLPRVRCNMSVSYCRYWNIAKSGLDIGHRGSGSSFKIETQECSNVRENTIASLKTAIHHGADIVEFDVQLSKDFHPIIYHDYSVSIALKQKKVITEKDMLDIPIKALFLDQLRLLKLYHLVEGSLKNPYYFDEDLEDHQPFPTLRTALEVLKVNCGFNIELKWDNTFKDGSHECPDAIDLNKFVDRILETVLRFARERRIIFSSFNADVCTMVKLKQNVYPVLFLTQGETKKYPSYEDPRSWNFKAGVKFVKMEKMLGLNAHAEDILREPSLVEYAQLAGIILFCWGDDTADSNTIAYLKKLGLHGIIYDKIYQYIEDKKKEKIYLLEASASQRNLFLAAAQPEPAAPSITGAKTVSAIALLNKTINLHQLRDQDNMSTATSLVSLESDPDTLTLKKSTRSVN